VPAAAVIPAPIAYIKVVAVKKLVVEFVAEGMRLLYKKVIAIHCHTLGKRRPP
jgi:hypothetical protein